MNENSTTDTTKFKEGDIVSLKSGGQGMTVERARPARVEASMSSLRPRMLPAMYDLVFFDGQQTFQRAQSVSEVLIKGVVTTTDYLGLNVEQARNHVLDPIAIDAAIEMATDSERAGEELQTQMLNGIRGYLFVMQGKL